jgi:TolB-like protein/Tfp pilus assembly protein PilF
MNNPAPDGDFAGVWAALRRRKVVQWGVAYAAGAWLLMQVLEYFSGTFDWPRQIQQLSTLALLIGLPIVLVLAWYHGDRGEQRVRGTELSIVALLLLLGGGIVWYYQHALETSTIASPSTPSAPAIPTDASIAVLPFANMSGNPADEYFSDGLAEELLNSLTRIEGLKVAARTTSFQYKGRTGDVSEIARQLRVAHILEGSVRRSRSRVRVTAQLIKADDGYHLWSESYDRELNDIFDVQSDIAGRIAEKLRVELVPRPTTSDAAAFDLLLRARHLMRQRNEPALLESRKLLEQALDHDPKYAAAWSALAMVLNVLPTYAPARVQPETLESSEKAARRANDLDAAMAEPLTVLANLHEMRRDWVEADRLYDKALALDPEDPTSQFWRANNLSSAGYLAEARVHFQRALVLDPTNVAVHYWFALQLGAEDEFESALAAVAKAEQLGAVKFADVYGGLIHLAKGDRPGAVERWNRYFEAQGIRTRAPQLLVEAVTDARRRPAALAVIDDLPPDEFVFFSSIVFGDADRALRVVESLSRGTDVMDNVIWWDLARPMRQTAEFRRLVRAVGLEQLWRARGWPDKCRPKGAGDFVCD